MSSSIGLSRRERIWALLDRVEPVQTRKRGQKRSQDTPTLPRFRAVDEGKLPFLFGAVGETTRQRNKPNEKAI